MGRFILCTSKVAKNPYVFPVSGVSVYTIEELCYYIYNNIYEISLESFSDTMISWLKNEVRLTKVAEKLSSMLTENGSVRDIVVTLLCSCDYYTESEIRALVVVLTDLEELSRAGRKKKQIDTYLNHGNYILAKEGYDEILAKTTGLSSVERGDILHNRAIASFYLGAYKEAGMDFKRAYEYNKNEESKRHYLLSLLINNDQSTFDMEADNYGLTGEETSALVAEMTEAYLAANDTDEYKEAQKYRAYSGKEESIAYADKLLETWKKQARYGFV